MSTGSTAPTAACVPTVSGGIRRSKRSKLYHRQVYGYAYHRPKVDFVRSGTLDDKRIGDTRFAALTEFLESIPTACPHDLFRRDDDPKARASRAHPPFANPSRIIVNSKRNAATETAAFIIPPVGNNKLRHETLQRFMLINDSVTVAIEVPIWLTEADIAGPQGRARRRAHTAQWNGARDYRPNRFPAGPQRCVTHPRLQAGCPHEQADRPACDIRACTYTPRIGP
jgi:hypothetical protein